MTSCDITERTEIRALQAWHAAYLVSGIKGYDWHIESVGDAVCSVSSTDPSILLNRVLGLGSEGPPSEDQLRAIRAVYDKAGVDRFFLHVVPAWKGDDTNDLLDATGYRKYRGWMKFVYAARAINEAKTDLEIRPVGPEHGEAFAAIAAPAFDLLEVSQPVVALLTGLEGQMAFMSFDGETPAGTGTIFVDGATAALDWGATHPHFRRRGGQTAMLGRRIRYARDLGCETICTMTGEAMPNDPQHSYNNILKNGFEEAYLRENWIPASGD